MGYCLSKSIDIPIPDAKQLSDKSVKENDGADTSHDSRGNQESRDDKIKHFSDIKDEHKSLNTDDLSCRIKDVSTSVENEATGTGRTDERDAVLEPCATTRSKRSPWNGYLEMGFWEKMLKDSSQDVSTVETNIDNHEIRISDVVWGDFTSLPEDQPKVFSIFVSSTFTDTEEERNLLIEDVQPYMRELCGLFGYEFRFCEMRWGVRDEASEDHQTANLCLQELQRCQRESCGINFITLLCDKYGFCPFPSEIIKSEFEELISYVSSNDDKSLLMKWFKLDQNKFDPVYVLQTISSVLTDYNSSDAEKRKQAKNQWWSDFETMQKTLKEASKSLIDQDARMLYEISVTEFEILNGLVNTQNPNKTCFVINRTISDIENKVSESKAGKFIDIDWDTKTVNLDSRGRLLLLKNKKIPSILNKSNIKSYEIDWCEKGIQKESHIGYLQDVTETICAVVFESIKNHFREKLQLSNENTPEDRLIREIMQQAKLIDGLSKDVSIREDMHAQIEDYVRNTGLNGYDESLPLIIYGESGSGKSTIMATAILNRIFMKRQSGSNNDDAVIYRFIGATPGTANTKDLLASLTLQMRIMKSKIEGKHDIPDDLGELSKRFKEEIQSLSDTCPVVIFLDALDQLSDANVISDVFWIPKTLPKNVKIVISTTISGYFGYLEDTIDSQNVVVVRELKDDMYEMMIIHWLEADGRELSIEQYQMLKLACSRCPSPLFARLAYEETKKWRSYTDVTKHLMSSALKVEDLINQLFERLITTHGKLLFQRAVAYLTASRYGLSRQELEDILSCDDDVLDDVFQWWIPPIRRIPQLQIVRLLADLSNYLVETMRFSDGVPLLRWFHKQFRERAQNMEQDDKAALHTVLAYYFCGYWAEHGKPHIKKGSSDEEVTADRKIPKNPLIIQGKLIKRQKAAEESKSFVVGSSCKVNTRRLDEHCFHLIKGKMFDTASDVLCSLEYVHSKVLNNRLEDLKQEYAMALTEAPFDFVKKEIVEDFSSFVLQRGHILQMFPSLTYQEACNYRPGSSVAKSYETLEEKPQFLLKTSVCRNDESSFTVIRGHTGPVISVSFQRSQGNKIKTLVASGSLDGKIKVWEYRSGLLRVSLKGHDKAVNHLDLVEDYLLSISADGKIILWSLLDFSSNVVMERYDRDGNIIPGNYCKLVKESTYCEGICSAWDDGSVCFSDMKGEWIWHSDVYGYAATCFSFCGDCELVVGYGDGQIKCYEIVIEQGKTILNNVILDGISTDECLVECFNIHSQSGVYVVIGKEKRIRTQYSMDSNSNWARNRFKNDPYVQQLMKEGMALTDAIKNKMDLDMSSTGAFVMRRDTAKGCLSKCIVDGLKTPHEYVSADLHFPYLATGGSDGSIRLWKIDQSTESNDITVTLLEEFGGHSAEVNDVKFSQSGMFLVSVSDDSDIRIWSTAKAAVQKLSLNHLVAETKISYGITGCIANKNSKKNGSVVVTWGKRGLVSAWKDSRLLWTKICCSSEDITSAAVTPDGGKVMVGGDNYYELLDGKTGSTFDVSRSCVGRRVRICDFSSDGKTALVGDECDIRLVVVEPKMEALGFADTKWKAHDSPVNCGQFPKEKYYICSASLDGCIKAWNESHECELVISVGCQLLALNCVLSTNKISCIVKGKPFDNVTALFEKARKVSEISTASSSLLPEVVSQHDFPENASKLEPVADTSPKAQTSVPSTANALKGDVFPAAPSTETPFPKAPIQKTERTCSNVDVAREGFIPAASSTETSTTTPTHEANFDDPFMLNPDNPHLPPPSLGGADFGPGVPPMSEEMYQNLQKLMEMFENPPDFESDNCIQSAEVPCHKPGPHRLQKKQNREIQYRKKTEVEETTILVFELPSSGVEFKTLLKQTRPGLTCCCLSSDGSTLYSSSMTGEVSVWRTLKDDWYDIARSVFDGDSFISSFEGRSDKVIVASKSAISTLTLIEN